MGIKLGDAIVYLAAENAQLKKDLAEGKKQTTAWTVAVGTAVGNLMGQAIGGGIRLATGAVKTLGKELVFLTMDAAKLESTSNTFKNLAESIGGDAAEAMEQLRTATRGMVADADLMQAGNKFLAMGLADTTEGAAELAEVATQLGMAMGEDATGSMENFALMMANQSIPRLDSFGISSSKVRDRIKELMDATEGMTREAAFNAAVMEQAALTMEKVGEQAGTSAAKMAAMQATLANLKLKAGQALQPILDAIVSIGAALVEKYGPKIEAWLERLKGPMESLGEALKFLVDGDFDSFFGSLSDALVALGVPQETLDKLFWFFKDMGAAIQALKDGDIEGFIQNFKQALYDLGVSEETLGQLESAFWSLLESWRELKTYWAEEFSPFLDRVKEQFGELRTEIGERFAGPLDRLNTAWKNLLETLGIASGDSEGHFGRFLGRLVSWLTEGVLDQQLGQITTFIDQFAAALDSVNIAIEWLRENGAFEWLSEQFEKMSQWVLPDWLTPGSPTPFELGLKGITDAMTDLSSLGAPQLQAAFQGMGQGNEDNRRNVTVYGGVQNYGQQGAENPLENLWNLGAA